jgi:ElaB/YqjD/DUF883 family membrane-anchored ribosome-binding protein
MSQTSTTPANNELKILVRDAQALFDEAKAAGGTEFEELHKKGMILLDHAISIANNLHDTASRKGHKIAHDTQEYVHEKPWRFIGVAGAVGLIIGMLIVKR